MKFFLDTANVEQVRTAASWGILDGVTTNPTLVAREGREHRALIQEIARYVRGPISVETTSLDAEGMVREAEEFVGWVDNVVVKVPMTPEGLRAVVALRDRNIRTNVTLVFTPMQALLAAKAGAYFVSPFVGRLDDIGHVGMDVVRDAVEILQSYGYDTQVLAASLRSPLHVLEAARAGADIATMPFATLESLFRHPLTDQGIERFLADWRRLQAELEDRRAKVGS
ncbi:MAG: fructose-6-phosphate aldolase [Armatimonadota bacterium]|nr:fructose-6-phosphate aldolase [Armatimonadota bacterium]MDR5696102.1 fructose-6-phosphate aldolase [Armatimonadota bacterium]